jgi:hypothetical protein
MGLGLDYSEKHTATVEWFLVNEKELATERSVDFSSVRWTSDPTPWEEYKANPVYNCFGFVLDIRAYLQPSSIWGDLEGDPRHQWFGELKQSPDQNTWTRQYQEAAELMGFLDCGKDSSWEEDFEKIVLVHSGGVFKHSALQISAELWKSKLGEYSDVVHSLDWIFTIYGRGCIFMKRTRQPRNLK